MFVISRVFVGSSARARANVADARHVARHIGMQRAVGKEDPLRYFLGMETGTADAEWRTFKATTPGIDTDSIMQVRR